MLLGLFIEKGEQELKDCEEKDMFCTHFFFKVINSAE